MKRVFSNSLAALAAGLCLRLFFVLKFPANSGDTVLYEQIATKLVEHHVYAMTVGGEITPVDLRMPGLSGVSSRHLCPDGTHRRGRAHGRAAAQIGVDLLSCLVIARGWRHSWRAPL